MKMATKRDSFIKRTGSWRQGQVAEKRWHRIFPDAVKSSEEDDIKKHVDFWHNGVGVDVKGNNHPNEIWLEFMNVNGDNGWMLGEAKYIAFDVPELRGFIRVERKELLDWCKDNVSKVFVNKKDAYRKLYRRRGRKDMITFITVNDLAEINTSLLINYVSWMRDPQSGSRIPIKMASNI
jgi:hypothetical protein